MRRGGLGMAHSIPISVVILWTDARDRLLDCLRTLIDQVHAVDGEVLVVAARDQAEPSAEWTGSLPVRWVWVEPPLAEPRCWAAGAAAARGIRVAFGQARCRYAPGWAEAAVNALNDAGLVAAGPVQEPSGRIPALAAYLCDYGAFADPDGQGGGKAASANIVFDRQALLRLARGGRLDKTQVLAQSQFHVRWVPAMAVKIEPAASFWSMARLRFHRGRRYAAQRAQRWSHMLRGAAGCASAGLPALLLGRLIADRYLRRRFGRALVLGLPCLAVLLATWSLGEIAGYWTGAGSSERSV